MSGVVLKKFNKKKLGSNTYRFQGFLERIASIDFDVSRKTRQRLAVDNISVDTDAKSGHSYFLEALLRCREKDCTGSFFDFNQDVYSLSQSLPMVLHNKDKIIDILLDHLQRPGSLSIISFAELISVLARDIRGEFYVFFDKVLLAMMDMVILHVSSPEVLEALFSTLAFLFKFLIKYIVREADIVHIFNTHFIRLLANRKPYIRKFAAEAFSFLLRKLPQAHTKKVLFAVLTYPVLKPVMKKRPSTQEHTSEKAAMDMDKPDTETSALSSAHESVLLTDREMEWFRHGMGALFFHVLKGVNNGFHSCSNHFLPALLYTLSYKAYRVKSKGKSKKVKNETNEKNSGSNDRETERQIEHHRSEIISLSLRRLCNHTRAHTCSALWQLLLSRSSAVVEDVRRCISLVKKLRKRSHDSSSASNNNHDDGVKEDLILVALKLERRLLEAGRLLGIVRTWVVHRNGSRVMGDAVYSGLTDLLQACLSDSILVTVYHAKKVKKQSKEKNSEKSIVNEGSPSYSLSLSPSTEYLRSVSLLLASYWRLVSKLRTSSKTLCKHRVQSMNDIDFVAAAEEKKKKISKRIEDYSDEDPDLEVQELRKKKKHRRAHFSSSSSSSSSSSISSQDGQKDVTMYIDYMPKKLRYNVQTRLTVLMSRVFDLTAHPEEVTSFVRILVENDAEEDVNGYSNDEDADEDNEDNNCNDVMHTVDSGESHANHNEWIFRHVVKYCEQLVNQEKSTFSSSSPSAPDLSSKYLNNIVCLLLQTRRVNDERREEAHRLVSLSASDLSERLSSSVSSSSSSWYASSQVWKRLVQYINNIALMSDDALLQLTNTDGGENSDSDTLLWSRLWSCLELLPLFEVDAAITLPFLPSSLSPVPGTVNGKKEKRNTKRKKNNKNNGNDSDTTTIGSLLFVLWQKLGRLTEMASETSTIDTLLYMSCRCLLTYLSTLSSSSSQSTFISSYTSSMWSSLLSQLKAYPAHTAALFQTTSFLVHCKECNSTSKLMDDDISMLSPAVLEQVVSVVCKNLASPHTAVRRLTIDLLLLFPELSFTKEVTSQQTAASATDALSTVGPAVKHKQDLPDQALGACSILQEINFVLKQKLDVQSEKEISQTVLKTEQIMLGGRVPAVYLSLLPYFYLGVLRMRLRTIWKVAMRGLSSLATAYPDVLWPVYLATVQVSILSCQAERNKLQKHREERQKKLANQEENQLHNSNGDDDVEDEHVLSAPKEETHSSQETEIAQVFTEWCSMDRRSTDGFTFYKSLFEVMAMKGVKDLVSKHSGVWVDMFLDFLSVEYSHVYGGFSSSVHCLRDRQKDNDGNDDGEIGADSTMTTQIGGNKKYSRMNNTEAPLFSSLGFTAPAADSNGSHSTQQIYSFSSSVSTTAPCLVSRKPTIVKLKLFMKAFVACITHPKQIRDSNMIRSVMFHYLSDADEEIQELAVNCLCKWKIQYVTRYKQSYYRLIKENSFREELTTFHIDAYNSIIENHDRYAVSHVLIRILYPKLMKRKTTKTKTTLHSRRATILAYLGALKRDEFAHLIEFLIAPFQHIFNSKDTISKDIVSDENDDGDDTRSVEVDTSKQLGFLKMLEILLSQLRSMMHHFLPQICHILLYLIKRSNARITAYNMQKLKKQGRENTHDTLIDDEAVAEGDDGDEDEDDTGDAAYNQKKTISELRKVRQFCYSRFANILKIYNESFACSTASTLSSAPAPLSSTRLQYCLEEYLRLTRPTILLLSRQGTQHKGGLIDSLIALTSFDSLIPYLNQPKHHYILDALISCLSANNTSSSVLSACLDAIQHLLAAEARAKLKEVHIAMDESEDEDDHSGSDSDTEGKRGVTKIIIKDPLAKAKMMNGNGKSHSNGVNGNDNGNGHSTRSSDAGYFNMETMVVTLLKRHVPVFLDHIHALLANNKSSTSSKSSDMSAHFQSKTFLPKRELALCAAVSRYTDNASCARKLVDLVLPFLLISAKKSSNLNKNARQRKDKDGLFENIGARNHALAALLNALQRDEDMSLNSTLALVAKDTTSSILLIVRNMIPLLIEPKTIFAFISRQFLILTATHHRLLLTRVFAQLSACFTASDREENVVTSMSGILVDMNAMVPERFTPTVDYTKRMEAYQQINKLYIENKKEEEWITKGDAKHIVNMNYLLSPIIHNILYDLHDDELGIRANAQHALNKLITHQSHIQSLSSSSPSQPLPRLIKTIILPAIKQALLSHREEVRRDVIKVFAHLTRSFPAHSYFVNYQPLLHTNPDIDFFENMVHIQLHRRRKALVRVEALFTEGSIHREVAFALILPMCNHIIYEENNKASATKKAGEYQSLMDQAIKVIAKACCMLSWNQYYRILHSHIKQIASKPWLEKLLVRVICAMIDMFPFDMTVLDDAAKKKKKTKEAGEEEQKLQSYEDAIDAKKQMHVRILTGKEGEDDGDETERSDEKPKNDGHESEEEEDDAEEGDEDEEEVGENVSSSMDETDNDDAEIDEVARAKSIALALKIRSTIGRRLLPKLHQYLIGKTKGQMEMVRVSVAMAIVKLLKKMPTDMFNLEFTRLLQVLCNKLRSRDQISRDLTRRTLVDIIETVGANYFRFLLERLQCSLKLGFQRHVVGFVVHAVLDSLIKTGTVQCGDLDYCLEELVALLVSDTFGEIAADKRVDKIKYACKETRTNRSFDSFELIARVVHFRTSVMKLIQPLYEEAKTNESIPVLKDVSEVLRKIVIGLSFNPSAEAMDLLIFTHSVISNSNAVMSGEEGTVGDAKGEEEGTALTEEERRRKRRDEKKKERLRKSLMRPTHADTYTIQSLPRKTAKKSSSRGRTNNTMKVFGLQMLLTILKKNKLDLQDVNVLEMLDPFMKLICETCVGNKKQQKAIKATKKKKKKKRGKTIHQPNNDVINLALKCSCFLIRLKLPSLEGLALGMANFIFELIQDGNQPTMREAFKTSAVLIRHCDYYTIDDEQAGMLLSLIEQDMVSSDRQTRAFGLLKSILSRKFMLPNLYALIHKVSNLMIQSYTHSIQKEASEVVLQFLMDYPLGQKRLHQHLGFIINNLSYSASSGRLIVIELLESIVYKFPQTVIDDFSQLMFVPLVLRLVNDKNKECRSNVAKLIQLLLSRVSSAKQQELMKFTLKWFQSEKMQLRRLAAHVVGLAAGVLQSSFQRYLADVFLCLQPIITRVAKEVKGLQNLDDDDEDTEGVEEKEKEEEVPEEGEWTETYYSLLCVEKIFDVVPTLAIQQYTELNLWSALCTLNLHSHTWVRRSASRVLGLYFASLDMRAFADADYIEGTLFQHSNQLLVLSKMFCRQLSSSVLEKELGKQIVKNLLFVSVALYHSEDKMELFSADESDSDGEDETGPQNRQKDPLHYIFTRLSYISRRGTFNAKEYIFRFFAAMFNVLPTVGMTPYLLPLLHPLYRASQTRDHKAAQAAAAAKAAFAAAQARDEDEEGGNSVRRVKIQPTSLSSAQLREMEIKELAQEVIDMMQSKCAAASNEDDIDDNENDDSEVNIREAFLEAYSNIKTQVSSVRIQRRQKRKIDAVANPERHAKRKIAKNRRKKVAHKRKLERLKRM